MARRPSVLAILCSCAGVVLAAHVHPGFVSAVARLTDTDPRGAASAGVPAPRARLRASRASGDSSSYAAQVVPLAGLVVGTALFAAVSGAGTRRGRRCLAARSTNAPVQIDRSDTKAFRKKLMRSDDYFKFGKTQMETSMDQLKRISGSDLLTKLRANGFQLTIGDVTLVLAESYGFCWGVERAVAMAYEAHNFFPGRTIWATNEIIHNPMVNQNLEEKGMRFIEKLPDGTKDFSGVQEGDIVVLPAFGATIDEMAFLNERKAKIVDTTCPWVSKVWNAVEKSKDKGCTSIIHGKYDHEETVATKSFATKYLVVKDMGEAEYVAEYILGKGDRDEFLRKFKNAANEGFDPDVDLDQVGVANQTTMMKGETELIGKLFERVMIRKYGPQEINQHYMSFNTICDATQERQDAMYKMFGSQYVAPGSELYTELEAEQGSVELQTEKQQVKISSKRMEDQSKGVSGVVSDAPRSLDICLIVGGYNSSNTTHLLEIAEEEGVAGYHIDNAIRIGGPYGNENKILHKPLTTSAEQAMNEQGFVETEGFLPEGPITIGITSGASTPDSVVGDCLKRILALRGLSDN